MDIALEACGCLLFVLSFLVGVGGRKREQVPLRNKKTHRDCAVRESVTSEEDRAVEAMRELCADTDGYITTFLLESATTVPALYAFVSGLLDLFQLKMVPLSLSLSLSFFLPPFLFCR